MLYVFHHWVSYSATPVCTFVTAFFAFTSLLWLSLTGHSVGSEGASQGINLPMDRADAKRNQGVSA